MIENTSTKTPFNVRVSRTSFTYYIGNAPEAGDEVEFWLADGHYEGEVVAVDVTVISHAHARARSLRP